LVDEVAAAVERLGEELAPYHRLAIGVVQIAA